MSNDNHGLEGLPIQNANRTTGHNTPDAKSARELAERLTKQAAATTNIRERDALLRSALDQEILASSQRRTIRWPQYGNDFSGGNVDVDPTTRLHQSLPQRPPEIPPAPVSAIRHDEGEPDEGVPSELEDESYEIIVPSPNSVELVHEQVSTTSAPAQVDINIKAKVKAVPAKLVSRGRSAGPGGRASQDSIQTVEYVADEDVASEPMSPTRRRPRKLEVRQKRKPRKLEVRSERSSL